MSKAMVLMLAALALGTLTGCPADPDGPIHGVPERDYSRPLPPGELALRKLTDPADIPDFRSAFADRMYVRQALAHSLNYMAKPSSQRYFPYGDISHAHAVASLKAFDEMLATDTPAEQLNALLRKRFDVYISVGCDGQGAVLFTGYFTPILNASPARTARFRYPLYRQPADLVKDDEGRILGRRVGAGKLSPYPSRAQIEASGMLAGDELAWLADPFEVYIAHVQGSAVLRMPDGRIQRIGYAATNGHKYESVSLAMVEDGKLPRDQISLQAMIDYFKAHPNEVDGYIRRNPRFTFFAPTDGGARGCLNEPVTMLRSIATDKDVYPRACLAFIHVNLPRRLSTGIKDLPFKGFVLDQDAGGAIRAPGRCDVYMGVGPQAGELAGRTQQEGRLYYLFLKPDQLRGAAPASRTGG